MESELNMVFSDPVVRPVHDRSSFPSCTNNMEVAKRAIMGASIAGSAYMRVLVLICFDKKYTNSGKKQQKR